MGKTANSQKSRRAMLSPELQKEHRVRSMQVVKGDTVEVMRGSFKGMEGKVTKVAKRDCRLQIEGVSREKRDGTTIFIPIHASKVVIKRLNLDDDWRKDILHRRVAVTLPRESRREEKAGEAHG
jgi:large subunit ribosomal protein L24